MWMQRLLWSYWRSSQKSWNVSWLIPWHVTASGHIGANPRPSFPQLQRTSCGFMMGWCCLPPPPPAGDDDDDCILLFWLLQVSVILIVIILIVWMSHCITCRSCFYQYYSRRSSVLNCNLIHLGNIDLIQFTRNFPAMIKKDISTYI